MHSHPNRVHSCILAVMSYMCVHHTAQLQLPWFYLSAVFCCPYLMIHADMSLCVSVSHTPLNMEKLALQHIAHHHLESDQDMTMSAVTSGTEPFHDLSYGTGSHANMCRNS